MSSPTARPLPPTVVALTPGTVEDARAAEALVRAVGALAEALAEVRRGDAVAPDVGVLVREPLLEDRSYARLFARLADVLRDGAGNDASKKPSADVARATRPWIGVHDRVHLVPSLAADGVHLGGTSLAPRAARDLVGDGVGIGFSSHAGDTPDRWDGADWLFHAPIRATIGKPDARPLGFDALATFCRGTPLPVLALGGMVPGDLELARNSGAHGIAILSGLLGASEPGAALRRYLAT